MKTVGKFIEALKSMMEVMPLDEISVLALSKKCHVKRQTFYYHFTNIHDLLMVTFDEEIIPNLDEAITFDDTLTYIYNYYTKNKEFLDAAIESSCKDLFIDFLQRSIYLTFLRIVNEYDASKELTLNDKKAICRYHSHAIANVFINYLVTHKNKSLPELRNQFLFLPKGFLSENVKEMIKKKNR